MEKTKIVQYRKKSYNMEINDSMMKIFLPEKGSAIDFFISNEFRFPIQIFPSRFFKLKKERQVLLVALYTHWASTYLTIFLHLDKPFASLKEMK